MPEILPFPINVAVVGRRAFTDARSGGAPELIFTQGDTYQLQLKAWKPAPAAAFDLYEPTTFSYDTIKAGILRVDAAPEGGTWRNSIRTQYSLSPSRTCQNSSIDCLAFARKSSSSMSV